MRSSSRAAIFRPAARRPALIAGSAAAVALLLALALVARGVAGGIAFASFLAYVVGAALLLAAIVAGYWAVALARFRYEIGDGALTIVWGLTRQVVPLAQMERVVRGRALPPARVDGLEFPGWACHVGRARAPRLGEVLFYSTHRTAADILYLVTAHETYGLSPVDAQGFIQALQTAGEADDGRELRQEVVRRSLAALPVWNDRTGLALAMLAALLAIAATGIIFARYTGIPAQTVVPFPEGDHLDSKRVLLGIPISAVSLLLLNTIAALWLHRPLRPIAYLLLLGGTLVQALLLTAALAAT